MPELQGQILQNRFSLARAVEMPAKQGIDQFLDLGLGLP